MAFVMTFTPTSMTEDEYNECIGRLEQAGAGEPAGRLYHVCYGTGDQLQVVDVWDSMEQFEEFGKTLIPILQELGIDAGQPAIDEVHNIIEG